MARPSPADPTGFDIRKLVEASGKIPAKDPWARREQWRYTGPFTTAKRFKGAFPGFGIAAVAFTVYCGYEYFFLNDSHQSHGDSSQSGEHH